MKAEGIEEIIEELFPFDFIGKYLAQDFGFHKGAKSSVNIRYVLMIGKKEDFNLPDSYVESDNFKISEDKVCYNTRLKDINNIELKVYVSKKYNKIINFLLNNPNVYIRYNSPVLYIDEDRVVVCAPLKNKNKT